jgi:hypothetical protein
MEYHAGSSRAVTGRDEYLVVVQPLLHELSSQQIGVDN